MFNYRPILCQIKLCTSPQRGTKWEANVFYLLEAKEENKEFGNQEHMWNFFCTKLRRITNWYKFFLQVEDSWVLWVGEAKCAKLAYSQTRLHIDCASSTIQEEVKIAWEEVHTKLKERKIRSRIQWLQIGDKLTTDIFASMRGIPLSHLTSSPHDGKPWKKVCTNYFKLCESHSHTLWKDTII